MGARRARVVAAVIAAALAVAACGTGEDGRVTLTLATVSSPALQDAVRAYREVAPDVRIDVSFQSVDAYQAAVRTRIGGGRPPDIIGVWPGNGNAMAVHQIAPLGALADLSAEPWARALPPEARALMGTKDRIEMWSPGSTGDRRDLQPRGAAQGRRERPAHLARAARGVHAAQTGRHRPDRRRQPDVVGDAADRLRARALHRLRPRAATSPRRCSPAARRSRTSGWRETLNALPRTVRARLLPAQPERDHDRAPGGAGRAR